MPYTSGEINLSPSTPRTRALNLLAQKDNSLRKLCHRYIPLGYSDLNTLSSQGKWKGFVTMKPEYAVPIPNTYSQWRQAQVNGLLHAKWKGVDLPKLGKEASGSQKDIFKRIDNAVWRNWHKDRSQSEIALLVKHENSFDEVHQRATDSQNVYNMDVENTQHAEWNRFTPSQPMNDLHFMSRGHDSLVPHHEPAMASSNPNSLAEHTIISNNNSPDFIQDVGEESLEGSPTLVCSPSTTILPSNLSDANPSRSSASRSPLNDRFMLLEKTVPELMAIKEKKKSRISKALILSETAKHCEKLDKEQEKLQLEVARLRDQVEALRKAQDEKRNASSNAMLQQDAVTSMQHAAFQSAQAHILAGGNVSEVVQFEVFRTISDRLFETFSPRVSLDSFDKLMASTITWIEQCCSPKYMHDLIKSSIAEVYCRLNTTS